MLFLKKNGFTWDFAQFIISEHVFLKSFYAISFSKGSCVRKDSLI